MAAITTVNKNSDFQPSSTNKAPSKAQRVIQNFLPQSPTQSVLVRRVKTNLDGGACSCCFLILLTAIFLVVVSVMVNRQ